MKPPREALQAMRHRADELLVEAGELERQGRWSEAAWSRALAHSYIAAVLSFTREQDEATR